MQTNTTGEQHFRDMSELGPSGSLAFYSERDHFKKKAILDEGIRFLAIPYW